MATELVHSVSYGLLLALAVVVGTLIWKLAAQRDRVARVAEEKRREAREKGTRLEAAESQLGEAREKAGRFDEARRMLHDVRGSLGPIVSFADELDDLGRQLGDPAIQQIANAMKLQSMYAADLSRFTPQPSIFDVAELLRYLCSLNSSILPEGLRVRFDEKGQKWVIRNEVVYAYRLFGNLISNARRAALDAGGEDVRVEMDGREVRISNRFTGEPPGDEIYREGVTSKKDGESGRGLPSALECAERLKVQLGHVTDGYTITFTVGLPPSLPGALE